MTPNQGYEYRLQLDQRARGHTVLSFLSDHFRHSTTGQWTARIRAGQVLLNGTPVGEDQPLHPGATLTWNRPGWIEEDTPHTYQLIYQDEHLLAVDKPSGLPTLPGAGFFRNTLLSLVRVDFPEARPLHRLGRGTSGVVLFARNRAAAGSVSRDWPRVKKQYRALSCGRANQSAYDIRTPIGPVAHPRLGTVFAACAAGKPARSVARRLEVRADTTLFEVDLHTGRPHQIRIHLASIGHPLLGDPVYCAGGGLLTSPGLPGEPGYRLHAVRISLQHPVTQASIELHATPPNALCLESEPRTRSNP